MCRYYMHPSLSFTSVYLCRYPSPSCVLVCPCLYPSVSFMPVYLHLVMDYSVPFMSVYLCVYFSVSFMSVSVPLCRAPNDAWFACLLCTRTEIHPLQVCPVREVDPQNWLVRGLSTLKNFVLYVSLKKWEWVPPQQVPLNMALIPSKFMKRGWKYPLKHQEGGKGTPLKNSRLGALLCVFYVCKCVCILLYFYACMSVQGSQWHMVYVYMCLCLYPLV